MNKKTTRIIGCLLLIAGSGFAQDNYPNTTIKADSPIGTLEYQSTGRTFVNKYQTSSKSYL